MTREWVKSRGFELFPKAGYESVTLTCVKNNKNIEKNKELVIEQTANNHRYIR